MSPISFSALTMHSADPDRLAQFYRDVIGLPLAPHVHGTVGEHDEGDLGEVHLAVWKASPRVGGPFVPVFRVENLDAWLLHLESAGVPCLHKPLDLGEGKRVVTCVDPDQNAFRLIEIRDARLPE
jgi:predicted enzyme related to lactoylglutathione lyase